MNGMPQHTARKMRRLASLLGCREGEIATSSSSEEREVWTILLLSNMFLLISTFVISCVHVCEDSSCRRLDSESKHTSKAYLQASPTVAYQLKPRGNAPKRYTPEDYVNRGKKVVIEEDEGPVRRSSLSRMRNDEPFSSEEEEQEEQQEQQQQEPRQRTKRMAVRKQPVRTTHRGRQ